MAMPLFSCDGCGMRIERSMAAYWKAKGRLLCSSCTDRKEQTHGRSAPISDSDRDIRRDDQRE